MVQHSGCRPTMTNFYHAHLLECVGHNIIYQPSRQLKSLQKETHLSAKLAFGEHATSFAYAIFNLFFLNLFCSNLFLMVYSLIQFCLFSFFFFTVHLKPNPERLDVTKRLLCNQSSRSLAPRYCMLIALSAHNFVLVVQLADTSLASSCQSR